jgi:hypothetical protein
LYNEVLLCKCISDDDNKDDDGDDADDEYDGCDDDNGDIEHDITLKSSLLKSRSLNSPITL